MRVNTRSTMLAVLVLGAYAFAQADSIAWLNSYEDALRQARESNKLVMVSFYTDW